MSALWALESESDWQLRALGDLLAVQNGFAFSSKKFSETKGVPLIRIRDLKNDGASAVKFDGEYDPSYLIDDGDLLIGMDGEFVCYEWAGGPALLNQRVCRLTDFSSDLEPRFVLYGINKFLREIEDATTFTTVKHLSSKKIKTIEFPLPPLEEQKRIVAVLDQAFAALDRARANAEASLADAEELFSLSLDRAFQDLVEQGEQTLSELITIAHGFAFKSTDFSDVDDENLPIVLTPGNYAENATLYFRSGKTRRLTSNPPPEFVFDKGELTIVMTDLSSKMKILGKPAFIDREGLLHNQRIGRVRFVDERLLPRFLFYFMRTGAYLGTIRDTATGTMVRHTAPKRILSCRIPLPSIEVQKQVVERISGIEARCELISKSYSATISELEGLRQSILQKAFDRELIQGDA